jgi:hypothetical protein
LPSLPLPPPPPSLSVLAEAAASRRAASSPSNWSEPSDGSDAESAGRDVGDTLFIGSDDCDDADADDRDKPRIRCTDEVSRSVVDGY